MGILDEAIREHLELKRQHGADDSELKQLEDEAFGAAERPGEPPVADVVSEAPTEFLATPEAAEKQAAVEVPQPQPDAQTRREPDARIADLQEAPSPEEPVEEEQPAGEHEAVRPEVAGPSTEERKAIAEQPTEMYDVEQELGAGGARPAEPEEAEEQAEKAEEESAEIVEEEDEDFWSEQRLSDELDQALEAPLELDEDQGAAALDRDQDEKEDEERYEEEEEGSGKFEQQRPEPRAHREEEQEEEPAGDRGEDDLLEDTPDFLEESPEDDELWFEQKPPKDFDFDD